MPTPLTAGSNPVQTFVDSLRPWRSRFGGGILIAVSGGSDSTALARLFQLARDTPSPSVALPPLWIGHVNHGLRAAAADADADFVEHLASRLGMRFLVAKIDAGGSRQKSVSYETVARELRYEQLQRWASDHGLGLVATAHTADDQEETLLLNLVRGCGLRGLSGMPVARALRTEKPSGPLLLRPLLGWRREELRGLLAELGQSFRVDTTNDNVEIPRNAIRHMVLPTLVDRVHPGTREALSRMTLQSRELLDALESWSQLREAELRLDPTNSGDERSYHRAAFLALPTIVQELILRRGIEDVATLRGIPTASFSGRHRAELGRRLACSQSDEPGILQLRRGWAIKLTRDLVRIVAPRDQSGPIAAPSHRPDMTSEDNVRLSIPGRVDWRGWVICAEAIAEQPKALPGDPYSEIVDLGAIGIDLIVRQRRAGDRFQPIGSTGRQKLKEFLRASGVPHPERDSVPLVLDREKLLGPGAEG